MGTQDNERIAKLEAKVENHERALFAQTEKNETLTKLTTLMEYTINANDEREKRQENRDREQNLQMKEFSGTLTNISNSLADLNVNQGKITERVSDIENTLSDVKKDKKMMIRGTLKYIATAIGSIIVTWVCIQFGLK